MLSPSVGDENIQEAKPNKNKENNLLNPTKTDSLHRHLFERGVKGGQGRKGKERMQLSGTVA
jgi:hypothetical protein